MRLTEKTNDLCSYNIDQDFSIERANGYDINFSVCVLEDIVEKLGQLEDLLEEFNINDINELRTCLENEQKGTEYFENWWNKRFEELFKPKAEALNIIKDKDVNIDLLRKCPYIEFYNKKVNKYRQLTQEEYDLLRKELL